MTATEERPASMALWRSELLRKFSLTFLSVRRSGPKSVTAVAMSDRRFHSIRVEDKTDPSHPSDRASIDERLRRGLEQALHRRFGASTTAGLIE